MLEAIILTALCSGSLFLTIGGVMGMMLGYDWAMDNTARDLHRLEAPEGGSDASTP